MYLGIHVNCPMFCMILTEFGFSRHILIELPNIKFHVNPSSGFRAETCGRSDRRTDMTKLMGAFRDYANASKIY
jgi:hypothetical protein